MSYHIYTTRGIVLSAEPRREADRLYSILTHDLGLVHARARGVRKGVSKLRGHLEPFSISIVSLVRGKGDWRLTSARLIERIAAAPEAARPLALLEKLVQGDSPLPGLFDAVEAALQSRLPFDETFEVQLVSKILFHLGYLKATDLSLAKSKLVRAINNGLVESGLI